MMIETLQERARDEIPKLEVMKRFKEYDSKGRIGEQEITNIQDIAWREDNRDAERRKRPVQGPLGRRWSPLMNLDRACRTPSLFTWRC